MEPEDQVVRYAVIDGVTVAWSSVGFGPPLLMVGMRSSHLERDWLHDPYRAFVSELAQHRRVIRFDPPGAGLSSRAPVDSVSEQSVLEGVLDVACTGPVDVVGVSVGSAACVELAARSPRLVRSLVLWAPLPAGSSLAAPEVLESLLAVVRSDWALGARLFADIVLPTASAQEREAFARHQQHALGPQEAAEALEAAYASDISALLPSMTTRTLVLHRKGDRAIPVSLGREIAALVPGAQFVALEGDHHLPWEGDHHRVVSEILGFYGESPTPSAPRRSGGVAPGSDHAHLSPREVQVLELVAKGMTDHQIAEALYLSSHTVHRHVANARTKLGVSSRAAAAAWATASGLFSPSAGRNEPLDEEVDRPIGRQ